MYMLVSPPCLLPACFADSRLRLNETYEPVPDDDSERHGPKTSNKCEDIWFYLTHQSNKLTG